VAILDTGIDGYHPFLLEKPWGNDWGKRIKGYVSFKQDSTNPTNLITLEEGPWIDWISEKERNQGAYLDFNGHGTSCASLILDVAPNADLYIARVSDDENRKDIGERHVVQVGGQGLLVSRALLTSLGN
jgi:subtilisin family serine protease